MEKISNINNSEKPKLSQERMGEFLDHQMQLAKDLYEKDFGFPRPGSKEEEDLGNKIMGHWIDNGYSSLYRETVDSDEFREHPKFNGVISNLEIEDIQSMKEAREAA